MRRLALLPLLALAGCGTFILGTPYPLSAQNQNQQQLDTLYCKDQASMAANTTGRQIGSFLAGMTLIGAPIAVAEDHRLQRQVYADCMVPRGYTVAAP